MVLLGSGYRNTPSEGEIIQKFGEDCLVVLGKKGSSCYDTGGRINDRSYLIEILKEGTLLEI